MMGRRNRRADGGMETELKEWGAKMHKLKAHIKKDNWGLT